MFLLDTNVISELRRAKPYGALVAWLQSVPESNLFISAVSLGEIQAGIEVTRDRDPAKAAEIEAWADLLARSMQILPMDAAVFRRWAKLMHEEFETLHEDAMIAATAIVHRLTVVTRNQRDFAGFGVAVFNPFETILQFPPAVDL